MRFSPSDWQVGLAVGGMLRWQCTAIHGVSAGSLIRLSRQGDLAGVVRGGWGLGAAAEFVDGTVSWWCLATGRRPRQKVMVGCIAMVPGRNQRLLGGRSGGEGSSQWASIRRGWCKMWLAGMDGRDCLQRMNLYGSQCRLKRKCSV